MYSCTAQWSRLELPPLVHPHEAARAVAAVRAVARLVAHMAAAAGFAGVMWVLLAGPGFIDGRSSTVGHARQTASRQVPQ